MKRAVFSSFLALLFIGGIAFAYFYYQKYNVTKTDMFSLVPKDAAFVLESRNLPRVFEMLNENNPWNSLAEVGLIGSARYGILTMDSLIKNDPRLSEHLTNAEILVSAHVTRAFGIDYLLLVSLPQLAQEKTTGEIIEGFFGSGNTQRKRMYEGISIVEINSGSKTFAFAIVGNTLAASFAPFLVEDVIRQVKSPREQKNKLALQQVRDVAGKKVDASVYVNYTQLARIAEILLNDTHDEKSSLLSSLGNWAGLDLKLKPNSLSLSGFSSFQDTSDYLSIFADQTPQKCNLPEVLPKKTSLMLYTAFSDWDLFRRKQVLFQQHKMGSKYKEDKNLEEKFIPWIGNEYAFVVTETTGEQIANNSFAVFHCKDTALARSLLHTFVKRINASDTVIASENYKGKTIEYLETGTALRSLFGSDFDNLNNVFFTTVGSYVVLANQASSLRSFSDDFELGKTLNKDPLWISISENISASANRFAYVNINRFYPALAAACDTAVTHTSALQGINAFTFQASGSGNLVYSHVLFHQSEAKLKDASEIWATALDTSVSMKPAVLVNPADGSHEIMVQDDNLGLYLLNADGEILFKDTLKEHIRSEIFQVDYFKNDKWQFMFSTDNYIYLIDRKGEAVRNYPMKLPAKASNALAVFDYEKTKDYRLYIACTNNKLYAYQLNGKSVDGWSFKSTISLIEFPVDYQKLGDKDFLIVSDTSGSVFVLDRKGKARVDMEGSANSRFVSPLRIVTGKTIAESVLVSANSSGTIFSFRFDGKLDSLHFESTQPVLAFDVCDLNADHFADYIFTDSSSVRVLGNDSMVLFTNNFASPDKYVPQRFVFQNAKGKVGFSSKANNEIYLFNDDGSMYSGFPLKGSTAFSISDFTGTGKMNIVVGSTDKNIYLYSLE